MEQLALDQIAAAHTEVTNVYALTVDGEQASMSFGDITNRLTEYFGDDTLIWDSIAEYLHLKYGVYTHRPIETDVIFELVSVYLGDRDLYPQAIHAFSYFTELHQGAINAIIQEVARNHEQIQAVYPAGLSGFTMKGFMLFECVPVMDGRHV